MTARLRDFFRDDRGATAIEYGLIASLVVVVVLAMMVAVGGDNGALWNRVGSEVGAAMGD